MGIWMTGIDHNTADIDVRALFSFTKTRAAQALEQFRREPGVAGCVLLSTCNRMELWLSVDESFRGDGYERLCALKDVPPGQYRQYFRFLEEREAVRHLFRLAGGLESRILGEDQIITQVNEALQLAREQEAADHVLETLFRKAVTAGKKVKTEFALSPADQSVVRIALETLKRQGYEFKGKRCMVIGNGVMGKLAADLLSRERADVTVTVRQYHRGIVEIPDRCSRIDYGRRMELFGDCDCVVSATVSPNYTLTREQVSSCLKKPVLLIDLAVPRDMESSIRELEQVTLYDIDDFHRGAENREQRETVQKAEDCLLLQAEEFFAWYEYVDVIPRLQVLKEKIANDLQLRLTKKYRALPLGGTEKGDLQEAVRAAAARTANRLLFGLKDGVSREAFREMLDCMEDIYGQDEKR